MEETFIKDLIPTAIFSTNIERQKNTVSSECKICGAPARYSYYGAIVCHSCKMFFKRNAENGQAALKCHFGDACDINVNNRHTCASCRLAKCLMNGMRIEMIRASRCKKHKRNGKLKLDADAMLCDSTTTNTIREKYQPIKIPTLNILDSDQSTLNIDQWTLLSNLVHCFNEYSTALFVEEYIEQQNVLPFKLRFKYSSVCGFIKMMKSNLQLVFEKNGDFLSLPQNDRAILLRATVEYNTSLGGMFTARQYKFFDSIPFQKSFEMIFQPAAVALSKAIVNQLDMDDTFVKLILAIVAFSTINYTTYKEDSPLNMICTKIILNIQDKYTDLTWRYLTYKYGHQQAVSRFSNILRCLFAVIQAIVIARESPTFVEILDSVIEKTEQTLVVR